MVNDVSVTIKGKPDTNKLLKKGGELQGRSELKWIGRDYYRFKLLHVER